MSYESIVEPLSYLSVLIEQKEDKESDDFDFDQINKEIAKVIESQREFSRRSSTKSLSKSEKEDSIYLPKSNIWFDDGKFDDIKTFNLKYYNFDEKIPDVRSFKLNVKRKFRNDEPCNKICLQKILRRKEKRTTLMIRHIPNKYTMKAFIQELSSEFEGKFDVFYLPIDYSNNCNLGFAFINFVDPLHIILFFDKFNGKKWKKFKSDKICELAFAKFQGRKELINHFQKGSVLNYKTDDKRPLILSIPEVLPKIYIDLFRKIYPYGSFSLDIHCEGEFNNFDPQIKTFTIDSFYNF